MPNDYLDKVTLNGTTYDIKDTVSGYTSNVGTVTGVKINTTTKSPDASGTVDLGTVVTSETDPTVPAWAKASSKPTYTASEVGAVPTSRTVNGKALSSNITLSASDVGALYWLIYGTQVIFDEVAEAISGGTDVLVLYEGDTTSLTLPLYAYELTENTLYLKFTNAEVASVLGQSNIDGITIEYSTSNGWSYNEVTVDTTVVDTYSSTGTHAISGTGVAAALGTLDSSISATTGQAISAITITDGKITNSSKISVGDANQNAFSNVKVGSTTISADTTTDTLELAAGGLVTLTPDATNDKVTISASYTETDPTVPSWAKASTKPTYTASEVGAVPTSRTVNGKALSSDITLSASDVSALPSSTVIPTVVDTYSSSGTDAISGKGVSAALGTLDSSITATTGQAISAVTITDGKITGSSKISVGDANQNAFSNIKVGTSTIAADTTTDTVELVASGLVSLTADTTNDKVTIGASYTETDPTVPSWAKEASKPTYTASEVGAVPTSRKVNGKALSADVSLSAADVGALPDSTVIPQGTVTSVATGTGLTGGPITASGTISLDGTYGLTTSDITTGTDTTNKLISAKTLADTLGGLGGGTITGVTAGTGLSGGGTSGGVTLNHSNSVTAQSTKGIYPIAIDAQGHISDYDAAIIPADGNSTGAAERTAAIPFAKVDSTSTSTVFTATVPGITELVDGTCCYLMNGVVTSAAGWTLNVNGLGAKPVYQTLGAASITTTIFNVNYTMLFVYNSQRISGGCWDIFYGYNSNTTYTNASLGQGYGTCATAAATKAKAVTLSSYSLVTGGIVAVKFTYDVPAGATLNVNSKGAKAIYYHGAAITDGIIKAGDVAYFIYSTYYYLLGVDDIIHPASSVASIDGTSATGTSIDYARADHKHSLTSGAVTGALGYTPYNSTNPSGYITSAAVPTAGTTATAVGTTSSGGSATTWSKSDHVHSLSSSTITSALGYTPYNSTNPDGYITANDVPKENFIVTVTLTSLTEGTSDKTSDEIAVAAAAGKLPVVVTQYYNALLVAPLSWIHISSDPLESSIAYFTYEDQFNDDIPYAMMQIWGSAVTLTFKNAYITPSAIPTAGTTATEVSTISSGGSAATWSKSDHVHSISSSTITSALGYTPYNSTNPNGYITSSAITAHIVEVVPPAFQGDFWTINDTFANILAMLSDDKKVVFRTTVDANKYNYWCYWFTNSSNTKIGLYRYEKNDESIQTIVFTENTGGTSLIGNPGVSWLTTYSPENTVYETSVTNVSVNNGTWKSIASLTLPAGTYIMQGNPRFGSVTNKGSRQVCISTSQNSNDTHGKIVYDFQATSGSSNVIGMQTSYIITLTSETTVYLNVFHTQGAALTVSAEFQAGRIR